MEKPIVRQHIFKIRFEEHIEYWLRNREHSKNCEHRWINS